MTIFRSETARYQNSKQNPAIRLDAGFFVVRRMALPV
jgi:hypothetical protein